MLQNGKVSEVLTSIREIFIKNTGASYSANISADENTDNLYFIDIIGENNKINRFNIFFDSNTQKITGITLFKNFSPSMQDDISECILTESESFNIDSNIDKLEKILKNNLPC